MFLVHGDGRIETAKEVADRIDDPKQRNLLLEIDRLDREDEGDLVPVDKVAFAEILSRGALPPLPQSTRESIASFHRERSDAHRRIAAQCTAARTQADADAAADAIIRHGFASYADLLPHVDAEWNAIANAGYPIDRVESWLDRVAPRSVP